jgi:hypothetical protein
MATFIPTAVRTPNPAYLPGVPRHCHLIIHPDIGPIFQALLHHCSKLNRLYPYIKLFWTESLSYFYLVFDKRIWFCLNVLNVKPR